MLNIQPNEATKIPVGAWEGHIKSRLGFEVWVGDPQYGAAPDKTGAADASTYFSDLLAAVGGAETTLVIPRGTYRIDSDLTFPASVHVRMLNGAVFSVADGKTLTIEGPITAGDYKLFTWNLSPNTASIRLKAGGQVSAAWFGAVADGVTDNSRYFAKCADAVKGSGGVIVIPASGNTYYRMADSMPNFRVEGGVSLEVRGYGAKLKCDRSSYGVGSYRFISVGVTGGGSVTIRGLELDGSWDGSASSTVIFGLGADTASNVTVQDCYVHDFNGHGIYGLGDHARIINNRVVNCGLNGIDNTGYNYWLVEGNYIQDSGYQAIDIDQGGPGNNSPRQVTVAHNSIKGWGKSGIANMSGLTIGGSECEDYYSDASGYNKAIGNYLEPVNYGSGVSTMIAITANGKNIVVAENVVNGSLVYSLGAEKVTNGNFAITPSGNWTYGADWVWDNANYRMSHSTGSASALEQNVSAVAGETYQVSLKIYNMSAGTLTVAVGGVTAMVIAPSYTINDKTFSRQVLAVSPGNITITPSSTFNGAIDDISVRLVTKQRIKGGVSLSKYAQNVTITGNSLSGCYYGIYGSDFTQYYFRNCQVSGNTVSDVYCAAILCGGSHILLSDNVIEAEQYGIQLWYCGYTKVTGNNLNMGSSPYSSLWGLHARDCTYLDLSGNQIRVDTVGTVGNIYGIYLYDIDAYSSVRNNHILSRSRGVTMRGFAGDISYNRIKGTSMFTFDDATNTGTGKDNLYLNDFKEYSLKDNTSYNAPACTLLSVSATLDFGSITAGGIGELTVTVTGAVSGDPVFATPTSTIDSGLIWSAFVSAHNTVLIRLFNSTAGAIDPASMSWMVVVLKRLN